ncbi:recombinase family protein [Streptococcus suis]|uniref:recombinase family protein n=1 Tax=Streptococcus parasuis TaxID=1501662 RepID=UPI002378B7FD|nr:recombinase family protein [Streptococcus parasuis]MDG3181353.1 recombinase family protein [Streptococcus suis]WDM38048.1 recombinase family protein [Streptococcus parasuis]
MVRRNTRKTTRQQDKIRDAFENTRTVEIIPAKSEFIDIKTSKLRVAAYCRVSTFDESQSGSFELQKQTYTEKINNNPDWELAGIYADQGASGTSIKRRENFKRMIDDCRNGEIDLIIVKSVSRFARNQLDFIGIYRELKSLPSPVGIYIEDINLNTLDTNSEFILGIMAIVAQGESEQKSASITWSIIERFKRGIPIIPTHNLLGYTKDQYSRIIIDDSEAKIVRFIYDSYIDGMAVREIAERLMENQIPTVTGLETWSNLAVYNILRNEKYKGEIIMQKTYTVDCFSHKSRKNNGEKPKYRLKNGIPSIIPESRWDMVQELLKQPRRKSKSTNQVLAPKLYIKKLKTGKLRDFIVLDPSWKSKDIQEAFNKKEE